MRSERCIGCSRIETKPVTLRDGTVVCNECPAWLYECEATAIAKMPSNRERAEYMRLVEDRRGKQKAADLREAALELMRLLRRR